MKQPIVVSLKSEPEVLRNRAGTTEWWSHSRSARQVAPDLALFLQH